VSHRLGYKEAQRKYSIEKGRLTRALNSGDPHKVIATVNRAFEVFNTFEHGWPDNWSRWERARDDATDAILYGTPMMGGSR
jgi:hypothetical protein